MFIKSANSGGCRIKKFVFAVFLGLFLLCYFLAFDFSVIQNYGTYIDTENFLEQRPRENVFWETVHTKRIDILRQVCEKDFSARLSRIWRAATNRQWGRNITCSPKACPLIVDENRNFMFCFIPKVASTEIKRFMLKSFDTSANESILNDNYAVHRYANAKLHRVSPMYYPTTTSRKFFRVMFVRHPFDRLVSAFRSKAEAPREETSYFFKTYWDKIVRAYRLPNSSSSENSTIQFNEFVRYLIDTMPFRYDDHWAPYWSRCEPCLVDYDFIGKLETAEVDFPFAFERMGIKNLEWNTEKYEEKHAIALEYFSKIPRSDIERLYKIYRLDFEMFGYTLDEFLDRKI